MQRYGKAQKGALFASKSVQLITELQDSSKAGPSSILPPVRACKGVLPPCRDGNKPLTEQIGFQVLEFVPCLLLPFLLFPSWLWAGTNNELTAG